LIGCNNTVWMVFQPNFYLLCVDCIHRLQDGKFQRLQLMSNMRGEANSVYPVFPRTVYHVDMPRMRIVTIQSQDNMFLLDSFIKQTKFWNNCLKLSFWIRPALWQAAVEQRWSAIQCSIYVATRNTRRGGTYVTVAFMQVTIVTSEPLSADDSEILRLPLREINLHTFCWTTLRPVPSQLNKRWG
jgi:hypothetical protein